MRQPETRCECGHPKKVHIIERVVPAAPRDRCRATVYELSEHGMNAWPCTCSKFSEATPAEEER